MKLSTLEIRGHKIGVEVYNDGTFRAEFNGQTVETHTLTELKTKLEQLTKHLNKVSVAFLVWDGGIMRKGRCTGIHVGNNNLLVHYDDEKGVEQEYRVDDAIDPSLEREFAPLCAAAVDANKSLHDYVAEHSFSLRDRVKAELEKGENAFRSEKAGAS